LPKIGPTGKPRATNVQSHNTNLGHKDEMNHFDSNLKMYATNGLRTADDWALRGRTVNIDAKACAQADLRGAHIPLYTRVQTTLKPTARR
jgi:hypothetical protein